MPITRSRDCELRPSGGEYINKAALYHFYSTRLNCLNCQWVLPQLLSHTSSRLDYHHEFEHLKLCFSSTPTYSLTYGTHLTSRLILVTDLDSAYERVLPTLDMYFTSVPLCLLLTSDSELGSHQLLPPIAFTTMKLPAHDYHNHKNSLSATTARTHTCLSPCHSAALRPSTHITARQHTHHSLPSTHSLSPKSPSALASLTSSSPAQCQQLNTSLPRL